MTARAVEREGGGAHGTGRRASSAPVNAPHDRPVLLAWREVVALAAVVVVVATIVSLDVHERAVVEERRVIEAVAQAKADQFASWLRERMGFATLSATSFPQAAMYTAWQASGDLGARDALVLRLTQYATSGGFEGVALVGPDGRTLWAGGDAKAHAVEPATMPPAPVANGAATLQEPSWDTTGHLQLTIHAPLPVADEHVPIVVLYVGAAAFRSPELLAWPTTSATGRISLFRRSEERLEEFGPRGAAALEAGTTPAWSTAADDLRLLPSRVAAGSVAEGRAEPGLLPDGTRAWGAGARVRDSDWYLLATMDEAEVASHVPALVVLASMLSVLVVTIGAFLLMLLRQRAQWAVVRAGKVAAAERRRATELLGAIADASSDAIYAKDLDGRYILFNAAAGDMVGWASDDVLGADDAALFPPDQAAAFRALDHEAASGEHVLTAEVRLATVRGHRVIQATNGPLRDDRGHLYGTFGIARDVTDRAAADHALVDKGEQLERTVSELQRFNDAMVDRELAMVELKHQLNEFAGRLGLPPPHPLDREPSSYDA